MKGLFAKPHYRWSGSEWIVIREDLHRLRHILPLGVLARTLPMPKARPSLRVVGGRS